MNIPTQPKSPTCSFILSGTLSVIGVLIKPGRTALQRIPNLQVHKHLIESHMKFAVVEIRALVAALSWSWTVSICREVSLLKLWRNGHTNYRSHQWCDQSYSLFGVTITSTLPFCTIEQPRTTILLRCKQNLILSWATNAVLCSWITARKQPFVIQARSVVDNDVRWWIPQRYVLHVIHRRGLCFHVQNLFQTTGSHIRLSCICVHTNTNVHSYRQQILHNPSRVRYLYPLGPPPCQTTEHAHTYKPTLKHNHIL